jgi:hypothetical protein
VAYLCQRWDNSVLSAVMQNFKIERFVWLHGVAILIFAAALIALSWYVLSRADRSVWVAAGFAVIGLGVTFEYAIQVSAHSAAQLPSVLEDFLGPTSAYPHYAGAFVVVIGIASFLLPKRRRVEIIPGPIDGEIRD